jgi:DmsE family decaheme c-type cytochrome
MKKHLLLALSLLVGLASAGMSQAAAPTAMKKGEKDLVFKDDARCTTCHDENEEFPVLAIGKTRHAAVAHRSEMTCTSCHGKSDAHVDAPSAQKNRPKPDRIFGKKGARTLAPDRAAVCLNCHGSDRQMAFWEAGQHNKNDVACDNCHQVHDQEKSKLRKDDPSVSPYVPTTRQLEYETCTSCHKQIRSQLLKPSHHPIIEGKVKCSDCHNPHGALSHAMVKSESIPALCTSCHAEKRGPWIWDHPPVEENCLTCHNSHGSNHNRLLAEKAPNVCQDCHDASKHPGTVYDASGGWIPIPPRNAVPNTRLIVRGCVNCHYNIHGSNAPANRGQFFLR